MKILITDDQTRRYGRLIEAFTSLGIERDKIDIMPCANDARDRLESTHYDLLILDILLPLWPEGDPEIQHSLDLLLEIHEGETLHKPVHILGITSDRSIAGEALTKFEDWTWSVVDFSESNDEWINRVLNCVKYIGNEGRVIATEMPMNGVDLAIICALEKPELEEILKLPWN